MNSSSHIEPLNGSFGIQVRDIDPHDLSDDALKELLLALYGHRVCVLRTKGLTKETFLAFARRVGEPILLRIGDTEGYPEISSITNIEIDTAREKRGAAHWHSDQSFKEEVSSVTMLYSAQAPEIGGETQFCDMAAAYAALPESDRDRIDNLMVEHRHGISISARPGDHTPIPPKGWDQATSVYHPLVRSHPVTDEKTLYAISGTPQGIRGMDLAEAAQLLQDLCDHAFQDHFITRHKHSVHDLVMWDNPTTMHSATPIAAATGPNDTRLIHRISLLGYPSFFTTE